MVAGPNGLDLKKIQTRVEFKICFKFGLKIKKITGGRSLPGHGPLPPCQYSKPISVEQSSTEKEKKNCALIAFRFSKQKEKRSEMC
jgi:hypothetical protein